MIFRNLFAFSSIPEKLLTFAIVGGGPAGLYCAKKLLKNVENIKVDVFERMPIPFGLIRYGVAPDNQDLKKFQNELSTVLLILFQTYLFKKCYKHFYYQIIFEYTIFNICFAS